MTIHVKKWGNSASVRIPALILSAARLRIDDAVEVREEGGRIVIEPMRKQAYDLDTLLAAVTDDNLHGETSTSEARGHEEW